jgi:uncharacterized SAM-binding protein YcdF (DUF218 family)
MATRLDKLFPAFVTPLGLALVVGLIALGLSISGRHQAAQILSLTTLAAVLVVSTPAFARLITAALEGPYPTVAVADAPSVDAIVVLGGGIASPWAKLDAADRLGQAYALWRAGKGRVVLISGGHLPWALAEKPEAELGAEILQDKGVPPQHILIESASGNTRDNAVNTAALLRQRGFRTGLLVTTAAHMPRALAAFRKAGADLMPWPAAFQVPRPLVQRAADLLPDAGALAMTSASLKEWLGFAVYRWRGWA